MTVSPTPQKVINAVTAVAETNLLGPNFHSTNDRVAASVCVAAAVFSTPDAQQQNLRVGMSIYGGIGLARRLLPENTPLKSLVITSFFGTTTLYLAQHFCEQIISNPQNQAVPTTTTQAAAQRFGFFPHFLRSFQTVQPQGGPQTVRQTAEQQKRETVGNRV